MNPEKIRPLHDRVLVKRLEAEGKSRGGILIPESAKRKSRRAVVVAVGPGKVVDSDKLGLDDGKTNAVYQAMCVAVGDIILINLYAGNEIDDESGLNPDGLVLVKEEEILAVIDK